MSNQISRDQLGFDFKFSHYNSEGELLHEEDFAPNSMVNEGFNTMFHSFFTNEAGYHPTDFEVGLSASEVFTITTTHANILEELEGGAEDPDTSYARQTVERNLTDITFVDDFTIQTKDLEFHNTSVKIWTPAKTAVMVANTGEGKKLVCFKSLSLPRQLAPNDKLILQIRQKGVAIGD